MNRRLYAGVQCLKCGGYIRPGHEHLRHVGWFSGFLAECPAPPAVASYRPDDVPWYVTIYSEQGKLVGGIGILEETIPIAFGKEEEVST